MIQLPLLGIYPKEMRTLTWKDTCTQVATVAQIWSLAWELPKLWDGQKEKKKKKKRKEKIYAGSSRRGSVEMNLTSIHEDEGLIPGFAQWVKDLRI